MKKEHIETIGDRIKKARLEKGLSNAQLSNAIGKHHSVITSYETGERNPSFENLFAISKCLDVDPMWLKYGFSNFSKKINNGLYIESYFKNMFELDEAVNSKLSDKAKLDLAINSIQKNISKLEKNKDFTAISALYQFSNQLLNDKSGIDIVKTILMDKQKDSK